MCVRVTYVGLRPSRLFECGLAASCELLLDEEVAQVRELPGAGDAQDGQLDEDPADDAGVCALGLVTEVGFAFLCRVLVWKE